MTSDSRNAHPYHMHEAILAQPEAFVRVVERNEADGQRSGSTALTTAIEGRDSTKEPRCLPCLRAPILGVGLKEINII